MPGPPKSRLEDVDFNSREYTIIDPRTGAPNYAPLPWLKLSFAEPTDSIYFTQSAIYSDAFSSKIQGMFTKEKPNVMTSFVTKGKGWGGRRFVPIKFVKSKEPCINVFDIQDEFKGTRLLNNMDHYAYNFNVKTELWRRIETMAIDDVTKDLPRSTREVTLLHWVCDWPGLWKNTKVMDMFYAPQWVDTHSHPAWFYPHAPLTRRGRHRVLLLIRAPRGTPMLRIPRHSPQAHRVNRLASGEWTHIEANPTESEVRLPPGRFLVEMPPTMERYAGAPVLLVRLVYEPGRFM